MEKEILNCKEKYPKRALLIINPVSGKKLVIRYIPDIIRRLMDSGYLVTTAVTSCRGEATEIAETSRTFSQVNFISAPLSPFF